MLLLTRAALLCFCAGGGGEEQGQDAAAEGAAGKDAGQPAAHCAWGTGWWPVELGSLSSDFLSAWGITQHAWESLPLPVCLSLCGACSLPSPRLQARNDEEVTQGTASCLTSSRATAQRSGSARRPAMAGGSTAAGAAAAPLTSPAAALARRASLGAAGGQEASPYSGAYDLPEEEGPGSPVASAGGSVGGAPGSAAAAQQQQQAQAMEVDAPAPSGPQPAGSEQREAASEDILSEYTSGRRGGGGSGPSLSTASDSAEQLAKGSPDTLAAGGETAEEVDGPATALAAAAATVPAAAAEAERQAEAAPPSEPPATAAPASAGAAAASALPQLSPLEAAAAVLAAAAPAAAPQAQQPQEQQHAAAASPAAKAARPPRRLTEGHKVERVIPAAEVAAVAAEEVSPRCEGYLLPVPSFAAHSQRVSGLCKLLSQPEQLKERYVWVATPCVGLRPATPPRQRSLGWRQTARPRLWRAPPASRLRPACSTCVTQPCRMAAGQLALCLCCYCLVDCFGCLWGMIFGFFALSHAWHADPPYTHFPQCLDAGTARTAPWY